MGCLWMQNRYKMLCLQLWLGLCYRNLKINVFIMNKLVKAAYYIFLLCTYIFFLETKKFWNIKLNFDLQCSNFNPNQLYLECYFIAWSFNNHFPGLNRVRSGRRILHNCTFYEIMQALWGMDRFIAVTFIQPYNFIFVFVFSWNATTFAFSPHYSFIF